MDGKTQGRKCWEEYCKGGRRGGADGRRRKKLLLCPSFPCSSFDSTTHHMLRWMVIHFLIFFFSFIVSFILFQSFLFFLFLILFGTSVRDYTQIRDGVKIILFLCFPSASSSSSSFSSDHLSIEEFRFVIFSFHFFSRRGKKNSDPRLSIYPLKFFTKVNVGLE